MDEQQLRDYTRITHDIEKSAVNHIINEYQKGGNVFGGKPLVLRPAEYQGQPVPQKLNRQMVIYTTGLRKQEVEANPTLIRSKPDIAMKG